MVTDADRKAAEKFAVDLRVDMTGTQLANLAGVLARRSEASTAPYVEALRELRKDLAEVEQRHEYTGMGNWAMVRKTKIDALLADTEGEG